HRGEQPHAGKMRVHTKLTQPPPTAAPPPATTPTPHWPPDHSSNTSPKFRARPLSQLKAMSATTSVRIPHSLEWGGSAGTVASSKTSQRTIGSPGPTTQCDCRRIDP